MSLLTCASPWTTDNNNNNSKKRMPTLRKTIKKHSAVKNANDTDDSLEESESTSLDRLEEDQEERVNKINKLIGNMSQANAEDSGSGMSDFQPLSHPVMQTRGGLPEGRDAEDAIDPLENSLQKPPSRIEHTIGEFAASESNTSAQSNPYHVNYHGNYRKVYDAPKIATPNNYYEKMGLGIQPVMDNTLLEKINYMIHMLEQQQNEKTSNLTEEFILYIFLGVFMIFIVDSFTRGGGKYVR